ncbi:zinc ribbon domain-containing protein [Fictibacillus norfolkensis]|uniref:zinc ribbon domain-containing protein n=1 Tax=Fictibacillus norfolkensis TaxID=2762233 RepID=UPI001CD83D1D|nr:zinc ribbon domain-containing protein [Fictibacillus norfolkensis]
MTGSGLSIFLEIQHNHFLFISCENCEFVEVYDPSVLEGKKNSWGLYLIFYSDKNSKEVL